MPENIWSVITISALLSRPCHPCMCHNFCEVIISLQQNCNLHYVTLHYKDIEDWLHHLCHVASSHPDRKWSLWTNNPSTHTNSNPQRDLARQFNTHWFMYSWSFIIHTPAQQIFFFHNMLHVNICNCMIHSCQSLWSTDNIQAQIHTVHRMSKCQLIGGSFHD